jgi:hypothetical protein
MADKSAHFTRFPAILVPKMLNATCSISPQVEVRVCIFRPPEQFGICTEELSDQHHPQVPLRVTEAGAGFLPF